ncbi:MAG: HEAT repeat domain-containing protein [Kofleriaceae bacterium]
MSKTWMLCAALALVACKKSDKTEGGAAPAATVAAAGSNAGSAAAQLPGAAAVAAKIDEAKAVVGGANKPALTAEAYEAGILGLADCKVVGADIDPQCPGKLALDELRKNSSTPLKDMAGMSATLGQKLIGHASPAVRVKAAQLMGSVFGSSDTSQQVVVDAAAKETDSGALQAMIRTVANSGAKNPAVGAMLLAAADHADAEVRKQAIYALSSGWNRELAGGADKLAALIDKDPDPEVRTAACERAGGLGTPSLVSTYEKHTASTDDAKLYAACMKGLVTMFFDYPLFETSNQAAYKLFLKRLGAPPVGEISPPWMVTSMFSNYADEGKNAAFTKTLDAWRAKAPWFDAAALRKALAAIVANKAVYWMARTGALKSLVGLGATKAEIEALKKGYDPANRDDAHVMRNFDDAIAKAK